MFAIHICSDGFSRGWINYLESMRIPYKIVDCLSDNIMDEIADCSHLLWHWKHYNSAELQVARHIIKSAEIMGVKTFPSSDCCWHFDDKVSQKYFFESLKIPSPRAHVFYDKRTAMEWAEKTQYPVIFKLKGGAGSENVKIIKDKKSATKLIKKCFGTGIPPTDRFYPIKESTRKFIAKPDLESLSSILKGLARAFVQNKKLKSLPRQQGYIYFQEFISGLDCDYRIIVIGGKSFAIKRSVRKGDFRASGSGIISYDKKLIPLEAIELAFKCAKKLNMECVAFDMVSGMNGNLHIIEASYGFAVNAYRKCPGYWDQSLKWHEAPISPEEMIITHLLTSSPLPKHP